jgi:hypothetical protein
LKVAFFKDVDVQLPDNAKEIA